MLQPQSNKTGPLKIFYQEFADHLSQENFYQFYSNRTKNGRNTFLLSDIFETDKLATLILEEYSVRGKLAGNVMVAFPEPDTDIPIFTFQLGGSEGKHIALLDISPTLPDVDYAPLQNVYDKYQELLEIGENKIEWVKSICSPYLIHCQYEELDVELFLEATLEYFRIWRDNYYLPGQRLMDASLIEKSTNAIYKYKRVLHDNDPAYGIFHKEWGEPVADAFFYIETKDHPALPMPDHDSPRLKLWENRELNVIWERRAQERVMEAMEAPEQVQARIIKAIEKQAAADDIGIITLEIFDRYKDELLAQVA